MAVDLRASLGKITQPCLVICAKDLLVPWICSQQLAKGLANSRYIALNFGGHAMNVTDPSPFTYHLIQWLESVTTSREA